MDGQLDAPAATRAARRELLDVGAGELPRRWRPKRTSSWWKAPAARPRPICARGDIANMGFARAADVPVVLVGDIDRGHVIAALVGAHAVLDAEDRAMIKGFLINKFRGDPALFDAGRHGDHPPHRLAGPRHGALAGGGPAAARRGRGGPGARRARGAGAAGCASWRPCCAAIANFDDFDPLQRRARRSTSPSSRPAAPLPGDADLVVLPGSQGHAGRPRLPAGRRAGTSTSSPMCAAAAGCWGSAAATRCWVGASPIPDGIEGAPGEAAGLGLLEVETTLDRRTRL